MEDEAKAPSSHAHIQSRGPGGDRSSSSLASSTSESILSARSLHSSDVSSIVENGRTYANDRYFMPCDEAEQMRLSMLHRVYLNALDGRLTRANLSSAELGRVLDVGAGPGDWAIAAAKRWPAADVVAADAAMLPTSSGSPSAFVSIAAAAYARDPWAFSTPFDYIHLRGLKGAFRSWAAIYGAARAALAPDGVIEVVEMDDVVGLAASAPEGSATKTLLGAAKKAAERGGRGVGIEHVGKEALERAGFVRCAEWSARVPTRDVKEKEEAARSRRGLGKLMLVVLAEGLEASCLRLLTRGAGWSAARVREMSEVAKGELIKGEVAKEGVLVKVCYGKKVDDDEENDEDDSDEDDTNDDNDQG
ncbi:hypothetical protein BDY21DRAFT_392548 [Lineolata rhizophorae]|uniref:S-adenosyl-L-methionine-dependent methyltransferase n=1 Tax=Lineolata rhizophorae TaxID=578093 RepID=A0A6A6NZV9_9PEZI|nr:hypothetical protein BDY21DRAFT_392548 [Lineolata rhizophorae]